MVKPVVSIMVLTYNHDKYIADCLESILSQVVDFEYEILINDDNSSDNTIKIIKEYQKKYPNIVRPVFHEENQYSKGKRSFIVRYLMPKAAGQYFAICEGDDYWIDPLKLQKQVDFLDKHKDYIIHSGNANFDSIDLKIDGKEVSEMVSNQEFGLTDFATGNPLITCTVMFRNIEIEKKYSDLLKSKQVIFGDWSLYTVLMQQSGKKAYKSSEILSSYRKHKKGVYSSLEGFKLKELHVKQLKLLTHVFTNSTNRDLAFDKAVEYTISAESEYYQVLEKSMLDNFEQIKTDLTREHNAEINALEQKYRELIKNPLLYMITFGRLTIESVNRKIRLRYNKKV